MEYLDIIDSSGMPTGQTVSRDKAHLMGIPHRTSHVWLVRKRYNRLEILLQKRSDNKDSFPGCYDISSAGHIPAGVDFGKSAVRELKEELGIDVSESSLIYCGDSNVSWDAEFHGIPFHDRQFSRVFALWCDLDEEDFNLQLEEVSAVLWMNLNEAIEAVKGNTIKHCILVDELMMVKAAVQE